MSKFPGNYNYTPRQQPAAPPLPPRPAPTSGNPYIQSANPYGPPQGGSNPYLNRNYHQAPPQPQSQVHPPAYGPQSTPAPYTPNTTPYPQPLHHQTHVVQASANVPSIPANVAWLRGCHADVNNVKKFLKEAYGFEDTPQTMVTLTDEPHLRNHQYLSPTRKNIEAAMNWLVQGAQPGDSLFLHYSGQQEDEDGDEDDGYDETILPLDFKSAGQITDDEMHAVLVKPLPEGVRLTCIFDSCHSGTALDLPIIYMPDGSVKRRKTKAERAKSDALGVGMQVLTGNKIGALMGAFKMAKNLASAKGDERHMQRVEQEKTSRAQVIMFSGCKDSQTSADAHIDGSATGAMSWALLKSLRANPGQSYTQVLQSTRDLLRAKYSQIPQLSSGHMLDMNAMLLL
ncbi:caspase domain-domain-containing protein [Catenaria anguillulae PL171]|uniref:Caspase domain-domain-containing protein n=1 Tax=Catenaria anguillulae PL171 TaxID=765915 RepID=A0A1Y2HZH1_9FUNG|nr:caspase domain-domain-containing protein [Catenaria anguillulae PL171]